MRWETAWLPAERCSVKRAGAPSGRRALRAADRRVETSTAPSPATTGRADCLIGPRSPRATCNRASRAPGNAASLSLLRRYLGPALHTDTVRVYVQWPVVAAGKAVHSRTMALVASGTSR